MSKVMFVSKWRVALHVLIVVRLSSLRGALATKQSCQWLDCHASLAMTGGVPQ